MAWIPDPSRALIVIRKIESQENLLADSTELFQAFFEESHSPEQFFKRMGEVGSHLTEGSGFYVDEEIAVAMELAIRDPTAGVRLVVDRLLLLGKLFHIPYEVDEPENATVFAAAIHYHATLLVRAMRQSIIGDQQYGYGDDVGPAHRELERLWCRYGEADSITLLTIRSISERAGAELAFQSGDYATALKRMALSVKTFVQSEEQSDRIVFPWEDHPALPPWLALAEVRAMDYLAHLRDSREGSVDWPTVIDSCKTLKSYLPTEGRSGYDGAEQSMDIPTGYWDETIGWANAQLTPGQLLSLYEERISTAATLRLSGYFLAGNQWQRLSEDARHALITADSVWMADGPESRLRNILNPLQRATENILYYHLWTPLCQWTKEHPRDCKFLRAILAEARKQHPGLTEYVRLLANELVRRYSQSLGIASEDIGFLMNEVRRHLKVLRDARNRVEHEPGSGVTPTDIRNLYKESLGIGSRGVLPELIRLLGNFRN